MTDSSALWPCLSFADVDAMTAWLAAVGFTEKATYRDDSGTVVHAEWLWPAGGGLMFGAARDTGDQVVPKVGVTSLYLVCPDPDDVFERAVAAGGTVVRPMQEEDYGGRGGTVADPEGNLWSFGSYQPS